MSPQNQGGKLIKDDGKEHGVGLKNVWETIQKYEGRYDVYNDGRVYRTEIRLKK